MPAGSSITRAAARRVAAEPRAAYLVLAGDGDRDVKDILLPLAIIALWVVLQVWVLPRFGVAT
jgi:hypothetical protein